ncbi:MAG: DUF721 domain-containing protein [Armatimonadota bacterium]
MAKSIGRKVNSGPVGVSRTVFRALVRPGQADTLREHMAPFAWKAVVSPVIGNATKALNVSNGILTIAVKSSAWATELSMQKHDLLIKINRHLSGSSKKSVSDIRFVNQSWAEPVPDPEYNRPWRDSSSITPRSSELSVVERIAMLADIATERDKARLRSGWLPCRTCGDLIAPHGPDDPSRCARCRNDF